MEDCNRRGEALRDRAEAIDSAVTSAPVTLLLRSRLGDLDDDDKLVPEET